MIKQDFEGADPFTFDEPATPAMFGEADPVDDFAVNHDEVELINEVWVDEAVQQYVPVDFNLEPTEEELHQLERELAEAAIKAAAKAA